MKHFLYVYPVIYTNCIFSVSRKIKTMAIDYQQVYARLINLFNLVHFHLMKMESIKYIKCGGKQEVFQQEKFALVNSFCIHIFDSRSFSMSYGCVSISVLRIILSVSSNNHILKSLLDCTGSRYSKYNSDRQLFPEVDLETYFFPKILVNETQITGHVYSAMPSLMSSSSLFGKIITKDGNNWMDISAECYHQLKLFMQILIF